ncbi:hypoxanthine phosphoribosyltransferase [PVC group bacterium]|nr:hypoxanthine phosphoribosyltransferase [PVC group bacterium]
MINKEFIQPADLVRESFALAKKIYDSDFLPDVLIVLWRGGTPVGIAIHEFLLYKGIDTYHTVVKAESYVGIEKKIEPRIEHFERVLDMLTADSKVLIVDDIFDSGQTMLKVINLLNEKTKQVKIATLYYKEEMNKTKIAPDFYQRKTDRWIVFPHELMGLTEEEIKAKDSIVADMLFS